MSSVVNLKIDYKKWGDILEDISDNPNHGRIAVINKGGCGKLLYVKKSQTVKEAEISFEQMLLISNRALTEASSPSYLVDRKIVHCAQKIYKRKYKRFGLGNLTYFDINHFSSEKKLYQELTSNWKKSLDREKKIFENEFQQILDELTKTADPPIKEKITALSTKFEQLEQEIENLAKNRDFDLLPTDGLDGLIYKEYYEILEYCEILDTLLDVSQPIDPDIAKFIVDSVHTCAALNFIPDNKVLNCLFNVGLKGVKHPDLTSELANRNCSLYLGYQVKCRALQAHQFILSLAIYPNKQIEENEKKCLIDIANYRLSIARGTWGDLNKQIKTIKHAIEMLDTPQSSKIVNLNEDSTCFYVPLGIRDHTVTFEFRKIRENYFFIIHNRGDGVTDTKFHGPIDFKIGNKKFTKTTVWIQTSKKVLSNDNFIRSIVAYKQYSYDIEPLYDLIYNHFIINNGGKIVKTDNEKALHNLYIQAHNPLSKNKSLVTKDLIKRESNFKSMQLYGTCVESNISSAERGIFANPKARTRIKIFTLQELIKTAQKETFEGQKAADSVIILKLVALEIQRLKKKLN